MKCTISSFFRQDLHVFIFSEKVGSSKYITAISEATKKLRCKRLLMQLLKMILMDVFETDYS